MVDKSTEATDRRLSLDRLTPLQLTGIYLLFGLLLVGLAHVLLPRLGVGPTTHPLYPAIAGVVELLLAAGLIFVLATRMQARLGRSERRYYNVLRDSPAPINLFDESGETVWGNDAVLDLLDIDDREELIDRSIFDFIHPDDHDLARAEMEAVLEHGDTTGPTAMRLRTDGGELRQIQVSTTLGWDNGHRVGQALVVDMTDRLALEDALDVEREFVQSAIDALRDPFYVIDEDGHLLRWNERVPAVTGYDEDELDAMHVTEFFPPEERERIREALREAMETGEALVEADLLTADGERRRFELKGARLVAPDGSVLGLAGVGRDVTERVQRERRLAEMTEEYEAVFEHAQDSLFLIDVEGTGDAGSSSSSGSTPHTRR